MADPVQHAEVQIRKTGGADAGEKTNNEKRKFMCDRCGFEMYERNCKVVCPNCGNRFDCSDLNLYFD